MKKINNKDRIQQRQIAITEFSDGTFLLDGGYWQLEVDKTEVDEAFQAWRKGDLKESMHLKRILKKLKQDEAN